ncbi:SSU ribosomal protein S3P [Bernardetia litoralis DSM 6794]|uniref:Small ribosomal subunit protein uS3 n=1 Tax=Bernardetia litoralis (strain ATCC 23117 / DSM 6794 / NBRC 15988 / NCIMB 1366 / Fx l1 / Sio-4) TaxID=880071 RepID=I4ANK3_BERLS|nr:30S ribosomal protein S3 [Bernardetia litoralis]AFM05538.1 SSU ribosomal protein S3P [Bernardetia litoralis DSM 6794]
MGQKVNPVGFRLGIVKGWDSNWYGGKTFADKLVEDEKIRKYIRARIQRGGISKIIIERTLKRITVTVHTSRPGVVIGREGKEVDNLKNELQKLTSKEVQINIFEIKRPEMDARLVGENIAQQLEARMSHRRAMKQAIQAAMRAGAEGIKVKLAGRLGGAEMARVELYKEGSTPLHTLRADIDYAVSEGNTIYGKIGIKVWIYKGQLYGKQDLSPAALAEKQERGGGRGGNDRGNRRGGNRNDRNDRGNRRGGNRNDKNEGGGNSRGGNNRGGNSGGGNNRGGGGGKR